MTTPTRVLIGDWQHEYNTRRPHSSLGMRAPAAFTAAWASDHDTHAA